MIRTDVDHDVQRELVYVRDSYAERLALNVSITPGNVMKQHAHNLPIFLTDRRADLFAQVAFIRRMVETRGLSAIDSYFGRIFDENVELERAFRLSVVLFARVSDHADIVRAYTDAIVCHSVRKYWHPFSPPEKARMH